MPKDIGNNRVQMELPTTVIVEIPKSIRIQGGDYTPDWYEDDDGTYIEYNGVVEDDGMILFNWAVYIDCMGDKIYVSARIDGDCWDDTTVPIKDAYDAVLDMAESLDDQLTKILNDEDYLKPMEE